MSTRTQMRTSRAVERTPFFYGWVILGAGTLAITMMGPSQTFTVSLFIDKWVAELGIGRANIALIYGLATLGASLFLPVTGRLTDRFGARRAIIAAAVLLAVACFFMGMVGGVIALLLGLLLLRFAGFGSVQLISNHVIAQWFIERRGTVMGLAGQSLAVSLIVFPVLGEALINGFGWRQAWGIMGVLVLLVLIPVGGGLFRDTPEQYGQIPDGENWHKSRKQRAVAEVNWTLAEARRTAVFWIFAVGLAGMTMIMAGIVFHQISIFEERGFDRSLAIHAFQIAAIFTVIGNLLMGRLLDVWSPRKLLTIQLTVLVMAMTLVMTMHAVWQAVLFGMLFGLISGSYRVMDSTVWANYFGRKHLGSIRGATMLGTLGGTAFGAYPLGLSHDYLGSFNPAIIALMALPLATAVMALWARRPDKAPGHADEDDGDHAVGNVAAEAADEEAA